MSSTYSGMNPDEYREELIDMGATAADADAAAADLRRKQSS